MKKEKSKKGGRLKKALLAVICVTLALIVGVFAVCMTPLKSMQIDSAVFSSDAAVKVEKISPKATAFIPAEPQAGLMFYQGARVQAKSYYPLMHALAGRGVLSVIIESPFNLAFFAMNAPEGLTEKLPKVEKWYIGGHSMGAEVAGEYLKKHLDEFDGLALFAGFVTNDFSGTDLSVISIYGENDGVLTGGAYKECLSNLPEDFSEFVIPGGNHSGFAYYGPQKGDNEAAITKDEQIAAAADFFAAKACG